VADVGVSYRPQLRRSKAMYDQIHYDSDERAVPRGATRAPDAYARIAESEQTFLRELLRAVWKRLWVVILVTLIFVGATVGSSLWQTPVYGASVKILVGQELEGDQAGNLSSSVQGLEQLTQTMVEAINSRPVAGEVIRQLGLQMAPRDLLDNLTIEQIGTTQFIQLYYQDQDPQRAQNVVNALADVSSDRIAEASASGNDITATVWEYATVPSSPVSPNPVRNGLVALGLGLMLGLGLAFLLEYLDDTWRSPEEVAQVSGIPTFGAIPQFETPKRR
jgi:capsular polysaccharide biosynthesis protein